MARDATYRIDSLAARIRWFDRYRRALSLLVAGLVWALLAYELAWIFGDDGPSVVSVVVAFMVGAIAWWVTEAAFAWTIAMWEVQHDHLARDRGLPVAVLLRNVKTPRSSR